MDPAIINAALTGMVGQKIHNPNVPISVEEIVADSLRVAEEGASIVHLHARGPDGSPTWDPAPYRDIAAGIRAQRPDLVICMTTSGRLWSEPEKRGAVLRLEEALRPDMASLTLGSLNFPGQVSVNSAQTIEYLLKSMQEHGVRPEFEVFEPGMIHFADTLIDKGWLQPPFYFNLLLGNRGSANAHPSTLCFMVDQLPPGSVWAGAGIARSQFMVNRLALAMGGGARVGLEDNLYLDPERKTPATNAELVRRVARLARAMEREPATTSQVRAVLQLRAIERDARPG